LQYPAIIVAALVLSAGNSGPGVRHQAQTVSSTLVSVPVPQKTAADSLVEFLLTSAAADFHAHRPTDSVRFRNVHVGYLSAPDGTKKYLLCGQFLPAQGGGRAEWTPFATIKTSGYEQMLGSQAAEFCRSASMMPEGAVDLSDSLKSRFDSLQ